MAVLHIYIYYYMCIKFMVWKDNKKCEFILKNIYMDFFILEIIIVKDWIKFFLQGVRCQAIFFKTTHKSNLCLC